MNNMPIVETMDFSAGDASIADVADRLRRLYNEVGSEIVKVARMMEAKPTRVHRERMASELERAAMLFLHAAPCLDRLDGIESREAYTPAPVEAPHGRFDGFAPERAQHA